jgi:dipeptidyl aminopeptidase/acylaminoacyl peptidase
MSNNENEKEPTEMKKRIFIQSHQSYSAFSHRSIFTRYGLLLLFSIFLFACSPASKNGDATPISTAAFDTPQPTSSPSVPLEPTLTNSTIPSPIGEGLYSGNLLLEIDGEIWSISFPSYNVQQLLYDDMFVYGMPKWSPDGDRFGYARANVGCPYSGTIWISQLDNKEAFQIGTPQAGYYNEETESCDGGWLFPAFPDTWSDDGSTLSIVLDGNRIFTLETKELLNVSPLELLQDEGLEAELVNKSLIWRNFTNSSNRGLLMGQYELEDETIPVWLWVMFGDPNKSGFLHIPSNVVPQQSGIGFTTTWSPDSEYLLVSTLSEEVSQLWRVHILSDVWELVQTWQIETGQDQLRFVSWSPNGKWVSWYSRSFDSRSKKYNAQALILNTENWQIERIITLVESSGADFPAWILTPSGDPRLVQWSEEPDGGIVLLHTSTSSRDQLLISFEQLEELIPNIGNTSSPRAWQP